MSQLENEYFRLQRLQQEGKDVSAYRRKLNGQIDIEMEEQLEGVAPTSDGFPPGVHGFEQEIEVDESGIIYPIVPPSQDKEGRKNFQLKPYKPKWLRRKRTTE